MAQDGTWPTRLLRVGSRYRVPTAELLEILGITRGTDDAA